MVTFEVAAEGRVLLTFPGGHWLSRPVPDTAVVVRELTRGVQEGWLRGVPGQGLVYGKAILDFFDPLVGRGQGLNEALAAVARGPAWRDETGLGVRPSLEDDQPCIFVAPNPVGDYSGFHSLRNLGSWEEANELCDAWVRVLCSNLYSFRIEGRRNFNSWFLSIENEFRSGLPPDIVGPEHVVDCYNQTSEFYALVRMLSTCTGTLRLNWTFERSAPSKLVRTRYDRDGV